MLSKIERIIHGSLTKYPKVRNIMGKMYQLTMYAILPKIRWEGNISRITPNDDKEYFFGYYDKSPWDANDRFLLCLRVDDTRHSVAPSKKAEIILIDTENNNSFEVLATTNAWNVQQGCMLQWIGPRFNDTILYNDFRDGKYCTVILNIHTREEKTIPIPVYSVSEDGSFALSLDFSRLHRLRPGYGYSNLPDYTEDVKVPNSPCIWYIDLKSGYTRPLLKYTDFLNFETRDDMVNAEHKVNHIMINPSGSRFMVIHRWFKGSMKFSRLITCNCDGTDMYNLSDDNFVSHCTWKNDEEVLSYLNKKDNGKAYYILKDKTQTYRKIWPEILVDGHPSYSPDRKFIVTDTYPDRQRVCSVFCNTEEKVTRVARLFSSFKYLGDNRCDLHPRWNRSGNMICVDSTHDGKRGLYTITL